MVSSQYALDVSADTFGEEVLERSREVPVLVDFWAPWCGPCRSLGPVIERVVESYGGAVRLAKVNTDEEQELAQRFGIRSLPTVKVFRNGEACNEFMGAQPEPAIRALVEPFISRPSDELLERALAALERGENDAGLQIMREALASDPERIEIQLLLLQVLAEMSQPENDYAREARELAARLPKQAHASEQYSRAMARLAMLERSEQAGSVKDMAAAVAADPANLEARYQLSARHVLDGDYEAALDQLLELVRRDRAFRDDAGRKGMLEVFSMLGNQGPLVKRYRRLMASALH